MNYDFYKQLLEDSPLAYSYHRLIFNSDGIPCDYEFIDFNTAFEKYTGLKKSEVIGRKVTEVLPDIRKSEFDWIGFLWRYCN